VGCVFALFLALTPLHADDGAASIAAGGIVMKRESRITMANEVLRISVNRVTVDYDFRNDLTRTSRQRSHFRSRTTTIQMGQEHPLLDSTTSSYGSTKHPQSFKSTREHSQRELTSLLFSQA